MHNHKGSILDLGAILLILTLFVTTGIISAKIYSNFKSNVEANFNNTATEQTILEKGEKAQSVWLNSIPFILVISNIGMIIFAFLIPAHPTLVGIVRYLPYFFVVFGTILIIAMYSKVRVEEWENYYCYWY